MAKLSQPKISRETRLLLITVVVSIAALWVLARIRFQERPGVSATVPTVLAQLRPSSSYADLALAIAEIRPGVVAAVSVSEGGAPALRVRVDAALTLTPAATDGRVASDRATGLTIVRSEPAGLPGLMPWIPRLLDYPRYLVAVELAGANVSLRPVFVGGLFPTASPLWAGDIWMLPPATAIAPGTFVFTIDGAFAGLAVEHRGRAAIVPATLLLKAGEELLREEKREAGEIGVSIQSLSPIIASASGARTGVVVTAIDANGPAADRLAVTDVIEAIDGQDITTPEHWRARVARLHAGDTLSLRVRANRESRDVQITAAAAADPPQSPDDVSLGLSLRAIPKVGAEVQSVRLRSRAAQAAIQPGDVITVVGQQRAPTPTQVTQAFGALPAGGSLLVAITRGSEHHVVAVEK